MLLPLAILGFNVGFLLGTSFNGVNCMLKSATVTTYTLVHVTMILFTFHFSSSSPSPVHVKFSHLIPHWSSVHSITICTLRQIAMNYVENGNYNCVITYTNACGTHTNGKSFTALT